MKMMNLELHAWTIVGPATFTDEQIGVAKELGNLLFKKYMLHYDLATREIQMVDAVRWRAFSALEAEIEELSGIPFDTIEGYVEPAYLLGAYPDQVLNQFVDTWTGAHSAEGFEVRHDHENSERTIGTLVAACTAGGWPETDTWLETRYAQALGHFKVLGVK